MRIYLNEEWKFKEQFEEAMIKESYDVSDMKEVRLPHTCRELPFHYFDEALYQMISGYRRELFVPAAWEGKRIILTFEGVGHESEVFLNEKKVGEHHCGYTAFSIDLSEELRYGEKNILAVSVNSREDSNIPPFGFVIDYMTYGGIYRDVYLEVKNPVYLADVFVKSNITDIPGKRAELISEITVNEPAEGLYARQSLKNKNTGEYEVLGENRISGETMQLIFPVENVQLWDVDHPELYDIKTELICDGEIVDEQINHFGFRKAEFKKDGFYLNENKVKLRGLNRHQSYPYVGYAMPESMQKLDADILKKELGVNAVRTSHYPQSHYFLDRCDELGLLVFTEIPGWQHIGDEEWKKQAVENVRDMVLQYRNHTSIILWGVRINESADDDEFYQRTNEMAHRLDDSRPTGGVRAGKKSSLLEDVYTYNDFVHDGKSRGCEKKKKVTSEVEKPYLISEYNGHMYPTKASDSEDHRREHAIRHANVLNAVAEEEDIAGSFGWCMFDYNTHKDFGSGDRICYHGVMDMFRNPKLAASVYAAQDETIPVLEISSSMDIGEHPACSRGDTYIITNADSVRMYKNDVLIREYTAKDSAFSNMAHGPILIDDYIGDTLLEEEKFGKRQAKLVKQCLNEVAMNGIKMTPKLVWAALRLVLIYHMNPNVAVDLYTKYVGDWGGASKQYRFDAVKDGRVIQSVVKAPMKNAKLQYKCSHTELTENHSYDVAEIRLQAVDENGNQLHCFGESVRAETEGPIALIGPKMVAFRGGMTGIYIKSTGTEGDAVLRMKCQGLEPVEIKFHVKCKKND